MRSKKSHVCSDVSVVRKYNSCKSTTQMKIDKLVSQWKKEWNNGDPRQIFYGNRSDKGSFNTINESVDLMINGNN